MTFEEGIKDQPDGYYSNDAIFQAGAASRDAEFARLRAINSKLCEKSNWYVIHTARLEEERDQLRAQINVLREALEEIADPIKFMRARLEDGEQLNGVYAIQMAESGNYLREIAKRALAASAWQEVE